MQDSPNLKLWHPPEQVVGLDSLVDVLQVDADGHAHQHVLGALHHLAMQAQQVRALQGLREDTANSTVQYTVDSSQSATGGGVGSGSGGRVLVASLRAVQAYLGAGQPCTDTVCWL